MDFFFFLYVYALATWCEELTPLKRPWCWERLKVGREGNNWKWDGWMASPTGWTWTLASSSRWWWTEMPGMLQSMGTQRVRHYWATELNCADYSTLPQSGWQGLLVNNGLEYWQPAAREAPGWNGKSRVKMVYQTHKSKKQSRARIIKDRNELKHNNKISKLTEVLFQPLKYRVNFWVKKLSREWSTQLHGAFSYGN